MKKIIGLLFTVYFVSCDAPVRTRDAYGPALSNTTSSSSSDDSSTNTDDSTDSNKDDSSDTPVVSDGFENCNLNYIHSITNIGMLGICQNTTNERSFKVKLQNTDKTTGTCFVPIHVNSDSSSYPLGSAECVHHDGGKEYPMTLSKDRSENINGVMVLKANALNGYMQCMSAKLYYMSSFSGCEYNQTCVNNANAYAAQVCQSFMNSYYGDYKQINF